MKFSHAVSNTDGLHLAAIHVHADLHSAHIDVTIDDFSTTIHDCMVATKQDNAVLGIKFHHMIQVHLLAHKTAGIAQQRSGGS